MLVGRDVRVVAVLEASNTAIVISQRGWLSTSRVPNSVSRTKAIAALAFPDDSIPDERLPAVESCTSSTSSTRIQSRKNRSCSRSESSPIVLRQRSMCRWRCKS
jgi:hypothetical protein